MSTSFDQFLDKAYKGQPLSDILEASPAALRGVTDSDADKLDEAFGIRTIRQMAENKFFGVAQAILAASGEPRYDNAPSRSWDAFFADAPLQYYEQHPAGRFRLQFGPVYYRGRLDGSARVLIIGQDPATNEILAHRVFVGNSGQRIQGLLDRMGITRSYIFVNTYLYSVFGQFDAELRNISLEDPIRSYRHELLDKIMAENEIEAIWAMGNGAQHAADNWPGAGNTPRYDFTHPAALNHQALFANWNTGIDQMQNIITPDEDGNATFTHYGPAWQDGDLIPIPRYDLPFGIPDWHGIGSRSQRDGNNRIVWIAP